jgi:ATP-dependent helicase HrpB
MPVSPRELPIYELESTLVASLRAQGRLIVQAPTGSGKSTQLPQMLRAHGFLTQGEVVVLQPRRLAARMLAKRVAEEVGCELGGEVGYQIRLEARVSAKTKIRFVTEGILLRQMSFDATLKGVAALVFDEFHERHLYGDISLARALQIQQTTRPDLKIVVMSATLDAVVLKDYLAPCDVLTSQGRSFPVAIEYLPKTVNFETDNVWDVAAREVARVAAKTSAGDFLVFMPGAYEISRTLQALQFESALRDFVAFPLHGELPPEQQDRAVARSEQRKIIVSTNVAETSLTIDGVTVVVDCGLARVARFDANRENLDCERGSARGPRGAHGAGCVRAVVDGTRAFAARVAGIAGGEAVGFVGGRADFEGERHRRHRGVSVVGETGAEGVGAGGDVAGGFGGVGRKA